MRTNFGQKCSKDEITCEVWAWMGGHYSNGSLMNGAWGCGLHSTGSG